MSYPSFRTAPVWYRCALWTESLAMLAVFAPARAKAKRERLADQEGGPMNLGMSPLGGRLIGERLLLGQTPGWGLATHIGRYMWAMPRVDGKRVVDLGCGTGYGTHLLSWVAESAVGVDISEEAVRQARERFSDARYEIRDLSHPELLPDAEIATCFELLEHLPNPEELIRNALSKYKRVLFSFPNPLHGGSHINPHHIQDWPLSKCKREFKRAGATSVRAYAQRSKRNPAVKRGARAWDFCWLFDVRMS